MSDANKVRAAKDKVVKIDPNKHHCQGSEAARNLMIPVLWLMEFNFDVSFDTAAQLTVQHAGLA